MNNIKVIIGKELKRIFGDRKMIMSLYVSPAIVVILVYALMGFMIGNLESDIEDHVPNVTVVNATGDLKAIMEETYDGNVNVNYLTEEEYAAGKDDLQDQVLEGEEDLVVVLPKDFEEKITDYENSEIPDMTLYYNNTENYSSQAYSVFTGTVTPAYEDMLLTERFEDLGLLTAFHQDTQTIYKEEKANSQFLSMMLPYLIVMMLYAGVMSIGVDAIAGEKERGTLSSMLISPAKRSEIVIGKLVSMAILSGLSAIVYCVSMVVALQLMGSGANGMGEALGMGNVSFSFLQVLELLVSMLVLVYLYVGIVGLLATISKDTKSAQSMISPVYIVVVVLGVMTMFTTGQTVPSWRYLIPIYGNALAIQEIVSNELSAVHLLYSLGSTFLCGVILTIAMGKAFQSEKIMFHA